MNSNKPNNSNIFILSMNEKNESYLLDNLDGLLKIIYKKKPLLIIVNTQNSSIRKKDHFQHIFSERISPIKKDDNIYKQLFKKAISNSKTTFQKAMSNFINLRTRIYFDSKNIKHILITEEPIVTYNYISISLNIDNYIIKNINFFLNNKDITYKQNVINEVTATEAGVNLFLSGYYDNQTNNITNIETAQKKISNFLERNNIIKKDTSYEKFITNKFKYSINNQRGGKYCMTTSASNKLANILSRAVENDVYPNKNTNQGFFQIIETLKITGIYKEQLLCLLSGVSEGHNNPMPLIYFLYQFMDYINTNKIIQNKVALNKIKVLIKELLKDQIKNIKSTRISTNCTGSKYLDMDIQNNYLLILVQPCKDLISFNNNNNIHNPFSKELLTLKHIIKKNINNKIITNMSYNDVKKSAEYYNINLYNPETNANKNKNTLIKEIKKKAEFVKN